MLRFCLPIALFYKKPKRESAEGSCCIFAPKGKNQGFARALNRGMLATGKHKYCRFAARSTTLASNSPLDCCILDLRLPKPRLHHKKMTASWRSFFYGGAEGSRTPVRKQLGRNFSGRSLLFTFPHPAGNKHPAGISSFIMRGMGKAYHTHGLH